MTQLSENMLIWLSHFLLIVTRMSALFVLSPVLGRNTIPQTAKIMISVILSFIIINLYPAPDMTVYPTMLSYALALILELLVGLVIGYVNTVFFGAVYVAGQIIDTQIGFGMVQVFDPQSNIQIPIVGSLFNIMIVLTFILTNGHMVLIRMLVRTYEIIPIGQVIFDKELFVVILDGFVTSFMLGVSIAIPIIGSALVAEVALGIMVRTAPQMNVFVVGIPVKAIIGLISLFLLIPVFDRICGVIFDEMFANIDRVFSLLAAASAAGG